LRIGLVVGNGFTKSLTSYLSFNLDSSEPLSFPITYPGSSSLVIDHLPYLKEFIAKYEHETQIRNYDLFRMMVQGDGLSRHPLPNNSELEEVILDTNHFLALAYSHFQLDIDRLDASEWIWQQWLKNNAGSVKAILSWNYDLVAELTLARCGTPYYYPGISTTVEEGYVNCNKSAILVSKPHGSCNYASNISCKIVGEDGHESLMTYPRQLSLTAADFPVKMLKRSELNSVRDVVDLVLPGEINRFDKKLKWVENALSSFANQMSSVDHLVVVGFSMMDCDRSEFLQALGNDNNFSRITVVNPDPSSDLINVLQYRSKNKIECLKFEPPEI
jgi:hypothetical protein